MSFKDWLGYALRVSSLFSEMKFDVYQNAIAHYVEAAESSMMAQVYHYSPTDRSPSQQKDKETKSGAHEEEGERKESEPHGHTLHVNTSHSVLRTPSSPLVLVCEGTNTTRGSHTSSTPSCGKTPTTLPSLDSVSTLFNDFLLQKPPSGSVVAKRREECIDEEEFKREEVYFHLFRASNTRGQEKFATHRREEGTSSVSCHKEGEEEITNFTSGIAEAGDGYVLTAEDEAVLTKEAHRQEHPSWWTPWSVEKGKEKEGRRNGTAIAMTDENSEEEHPPLPGWSTIQHEKERKTHAPWKKQNEDEKTEERKHLELHTRSEHHGASPPMSRRDTPPARTSTAGASPRRPHDPHSMSLYGELTSKGLRKMMALHWETILSYETEAKDRMSDASSSPLPRTGTTEMAGRQRRSSSSFPCILAIDIGSGTGKVVYEWNLLLKKKQQHSVSTDPPCEENDHGKGDNGVSEGQRHASSIPGTKSKTNGFSSSSSFSDASTSCCPTFCYMVLGIEIVPSRMAVAKRALHGNYVEVKEATTTEIQSVESEEKRKAKAEGAHHTITVLPPHTYTTGKDFPFAPLVLLAPPTIPSTTARMTPHTAEGMTVFPTRSSIHAARALDAGENRVRKMMLGMEPVSSLSRRFWSFSLLSSFGYSASFPACTVALSSINALHPCLLQNRLLLPPRTFTFPSPSSGNLSWGPFSLEGSPLMRTPKTTREEEKKEMEHASARGRAPSDHEGWSSSTEDTSLQGMGWRRGVPEVLNTDGIPERAEGMPSCQTPIVLQPHVTVFCCGVGFDEVFVRRLCWRLECMLSLFPTNFHTPLEGKPATSTSPSPMMGSSSRASVSSYWHTASIALLLPPLDVEKVLQSDDFPLFRCAQVWRRTVCHTTGRPCATHDVSSAAGTSSFTTPTTTPSVMERGEQEEETEVHERTLKKEAHCGPYQARRSEENEIFFQRSFPNKDFVSPLPVEALEGCTTWSTSHVVGPHEALAEAPVMVHTAHEKEAEHAPACHTANTTTCAEGSGRKDSKTSKKVRQVEDIVGVSCACRPRLRSSVLTYTHLETTWMKETPVWHFSFVFS